MKIVGIDPGLVAAVALLDTETDEARADLFGNLVDEPDTIEHLSAYLEDMEPDHVVLEQVGPMPGQGLSGTARFMQAYGILKGVLGANRLHVVHVPPQVWKKVVLPAYAFEEKDDKGKRKEDQKAAACKLVKQRYPEVELIRKGCKVPDHNLAEAVCLALFYGSKLP